LRGLKTWLGGTSTRMLPEETNSPKDKKMFSNPPQWTRFATPGRDSPSPGSWGRIPGESFSVDIEMSIEEKQTSPSSGVVDRRRRLGDTKELALRSSPQSTSNGNGTRKASFGVEQLLASPGSLRKGMPPSERERLARELAPTATFQMLSKVPRDLLKAKGAEGQNLRRKMLDGAVIVFFTAGYEGKRFVYERAKALGVRSVMIESADSWSKGLLSEGIIEQFIPINMCLSSDQVYDQALNAIQQLEKDPKVGKASGVATVVELSVPVVARLAEALGLPGHLPDAVDTARDKHATRATLKAAGLPTPPNVHIHSAADLPEAARIVGFPAVLKPICGAASLGVKKVTSEAELASTYAEVYAEVRSLVVSSGALIKNNGDGVGVAADCVIDTSFLFEKYRYGDEVDVDIVMSEGEWQYAAVSDNGPTLEPYFNETWAVTPSLLPRQKQVALKELAINSVKAVGFTSGVFHVECKYTSTGPHLIEVNARMGGGPVYETNLRTWNVCLVEETLFAAVGVPSRPDVPKEPVVCIANSDVNTLRSGKLVDVSFLDPLRGRKDVLSFSCHVSPGEQVIGPQDGLPSWLVEIVVAKSSPQEALDFLLQLEREVQAKVHVS